ncbi:MAG: tail fiber domain-containing protein, partial [Burkholderiales bacterium]|nr:tail fiber domain-containing protein [Burkholderiales bacterium]
VQTSAYMAGVYAQSTSDAASSVTVYVDKNGKLGTLMSSQRYKENIQDMGDTSARLYELRPVTYNYKKADADGSKPLEYGLIAEEVSQVFPDLVVHGKDGQIETVQYHKLVPMLLNEIQRLRADVDKMKAKVGN